MMGEFLLVLGISFLITLTCFLAAHACDVLSRRPRRSKEPLRKAMEDIRNYADVYMEGAGAEALEHLDVIESMARDALAGKEPRR